jgi:hypothetical protein
VPHKDCVALYFYLWNSNLWVMLDREIAKRALYLFCLILVVAVILTVDTVKIEETNSPIFNENFSEGILNVERWQITREGDFEESTIDVYDHRLRLRANIIGTSDDTVKFHRVRRVCRWNREPCCGSAEAGMMR